MVGIIGLVFLDTPIHTVTCAQNERGGQRSDHGTGQYANLHMVIARARCAERKLANQQRDRKTDACQNRHSEDIEPTKVLIKLGTGEASHEVRCAKDADGLSNDQPDHDTE